MITVVYGTKNGTQDSIAWWLCEHNGIGPQIYQAPFREHNAWTGSPGARSGLVLDDYRLEPHTECHRRMENIRGDIIAPMRPLEKDYDMLVWSNYFGDLLYPDQKIECDKLIVCDEDPMEDCFHYMLTHAYKPITHKKIDADSEVWWTDHKLVDGTITDNWKDIWYTRYHQEMHDAFDKGTLKYMWQINFLHWDVHHYLKGETQTEPKLHEAEDYSVIIKSKVFQKNQNRALHTYKANPGSLLVRDPYWFDQIEDIVNFLELDVDVYDKNLMAYKDAYQIRRDWFDEMLQNL